MIGLNIAVAHVSQIRSTITATYAWKDYSQWKRSLVIPTFSMLNGEKREGLVRKVMWWREVREGKPQLLKW